MTLSLAETLHMRHRCWRCRFKSEAPSIRFLLHAGLTGGTLVDIGANKGVFAYYMARAAGPSGTVYAFEAQPELGPHLHAVRQAFRLDNLRIVNQGLSSAPGVLRMRRNAAGSGTASFHHGSARDLEELDVSVTTLDDYLREAGAGPVRFIKCDVEGHELEVFRGAEAILRRDGPMLLFECHHGEAEEGALFEFLTNLGYDGAFFHVEPADHRSLLHKTRGRYVHFSQFDRYPYARPGLRHRNYLFARAPDRIGGR
ncbi:MAG: FkbM family methyltransferase [Woeseiaceae bacterium]